ncbi:MAG: hypothetical protein EOM54_08715 [Clostridia bacterium]|nr:hypothetical protein [Clostridia bacterium]
MISVKSAIPDFMKADKQKQADKTQQAPVPIRAQAISRLQADTPILDYTKGFRDAGLLGAPKTEKTGWNAPLQGSAARTAAAEEEKLRKASTGSGRRRRRRRRVGAPGGRVPERKRSLPKGKIWDMISSITT